MIFIVEVDGLPVRKTFQELKTMFNRVSFPRNIREADLADHGIFVLSETPMPDGDVVTEGHDTLIDGVWTQTWETRDFTAEELADQAAAQADASLLAVEAVTNKLFFKLCKYLVEENVINPLDPRLTEIKEKYLEWKTLTGN